MEEQKWENAVHKKALELIEEGFFDDEIEKKAQEKARELIANDDFVKEDLDRRARELIANDYYVEEDLIRRAKELVTREYTVPSSPDSNDYPAWGGFKGYVQRIVTEQARRCAEEWIRSGHYDKIVWEKVYDLIEEDPVKAAKELGIKEIACIKAVREMPLSWKLAWEIFDCHKDSKDFLYESHSYYIVNRKMTMVLGNPLLDRIEFDELYDAFMLSPPTPDPYVMNAYTQIPQMDRLEILEDVFTTIKDAGYDQAGHVIRLIRKLSYRL